MSALTSLIIGPGAIGALTCAHLQVLGPVYVHAHRPTLKLAQSLVIKNEQITLNWAILPNENIPIDVIWVCCKANQVIEAATPLLKRYPTAIVVLLCNGMGPQQELQSQFPDRVIIGSTTCGALPTSEQTFTQTSFGQTTLGFNAQLPKQQALRNTLLSSANNSGPLVITETDNIEQILWRKLFINACINPITAYYGIQNGRILDTEHQQELMPLIQEIEQIMQAASITPVPNALAVVNEVARFSATNWSSMAMDVKHGRHTEIDYINGYLIKQGQKLGVPTPTLEKWYKRIAFAEES